MIKVKAYMSTAKSCVGGVHRNFQNCCDWFVINSRVSKSASKFENKIQNFVKILVFSVYWKKIIFLQILHFFPNFKGGAEAEGGISSKILKGLAFKPLSPYDLCS